MRLLRNASLSLTFLALCLITLAFQAVAGLAVLNNEQAAHGGAAETMGNFLVSSEYWNSVMENWQSEYLQFALFIFATIYLLQRGSTESKELDMAGRETDEQQQIGEHADDDAPAWAKAGGWRARLYGDSLLTVMFSIFVLSWFAQSLTGRNVYNSEQAEHGETALSWFEYVGSADFWLATLENWQSEFLAVGSMAVLSIYLRQRGSPESKPVGAAHADTGVEG